LSGGWKTKRYPQSIRDIHVDAGRAPRGRREVGECEKSGNGLHRKLEKEKDPIQRKGGETKTRGSQMWASRQS